jgi:Two component regulator propeller
MKRLIPLYIFLFTLSMAAQTTDQLWGSYFSYYNTVDMAQSASRVYSASESALFYQNTITGELTTITSVDGLKGETITATYHSPQYGRTLVGNSNGLLIVINSDGTIVNKIDIVQEATLAPAKKKINHIMEFNGIAYISTNYGVSAFNIATLQFIDTYYLGPNGAEITVLQSAVLNGYLYVATDGYGIRRGALSNPNLNDFSQWQSFLDGSWTTLSTFEDRLFGGNGTTLYWIQEDGNTSFFSTLPQNIIDLRTSNSYLVATCNNRVIGFNSQLTQSFQVTTVNEPATFTRATFVGGKVYVGTTTKGVFAIDITTQSTQNITPSGPLEDRVFALEKSPNNLWVAFGGYSIAHEPDYKGQGVSRLTANGWVSLTNDQIFYAQSVSDIAVNPNNENEVYLLSYHSGLVKIVDGVPTMLYDDTNTNNALQSQQAAAGFHSVRLIGGNFDSSGKLWMANTRVDKPVKSFNGSSAWGSYSLGDLVDDTEDIEYGIMALDKNGTKWMPTAGRGLIVFNETLNKTIVVTESNGLPQFNRVNCVAIDNNNRVWVGTGSGLRTISSIERFISDETLTANNIVIEEDGLAQELLFEQSITDICVDGSNNKWIGTAAGAFLVSPDGQSTLYHFTKANSPLPSNVINDIEIDDVTGEVFFATDKGLVSYKGTSTAASDDLNNVYVYPNPVRPGFEGDVKISGLIDSANIKITDIEGNLVYETTSEGGTVLWDTRAFGKYKVASGVYMIFISSEDGTQTKVKKVMVVRGN